jgi:hypothetical protein
MFSRPKTRRLLSPNVLDNQETSVSINPTKSSGGAVMEDIREGLAAQGETDFFETSIPWWG